MQHQHINIWTLSQHKAEYDRYKGLLDGSLANGIQSAAINEALLCQSKASLSGLESVVLAHDICDIRKKYSQRLESLGKVRDLDGRWVPGYRSFESIAIDLENKHLHLLACQVGKKDDNLNALRISPNRILT